MNNAPQKLILLVEDDSFVSRAYKDGLARAGYSVELATDGSEAIKKAKARHADLVLLDLVMPVKTGFEVLEELRLNEQYRTTPIVVLSNLGQESDREKALQAGATDYLVKNQLSMKQVVEQVKKYLP
jgi:CheY-like chemotaxis protein